MQNPTLSQVPAGMKQNDAVCLARVGNQQTSISSFLQRVVERTLDRGEATWALAFILPLNLVAIHGQCLRSL